ncbi:MAG: hypothetical protein V1922_01025 [bacterium]
MKKIVVFSLLILFFLGGFFTSAILTKKEIEKTNEAQKQCQSHLLQALSAPKKESEQDIYLYAQKIKALDNIIASTVYFSPQISYLSATKKEVIISLLGGAAMKADASDLVMRLSDNLKILEIRSGTAFPSYPRKISSDGIVTITGIASLDGAGMKLGQPNQIFITLLVEKTGDVKQKGKISVDKLNTKVFLQGNSILDPNLTFEEIEL